MSDPYEPIMKKECEAEKQELIEEFLNEIKKLWRETTCNHTWFFLNILIEEYEKRLKQ